jgi:MscS family membrane protein
MRSLICSTVLLLGVTLSLFAQKAPKPDADLSNPTKTVVTHLYYLQEESYDPEKAAKVIYGKTGEEAIEIAKELKLVLDAKALFVDTGRIPSDPNYIDSATGKKRYVLFSSEPDIYLVKVGPNWYYSKHTSDMVPAMYNDLFPFGADVLIKATGAIGQEKFLGLKAWQWIGIVALILLIVVLHIVLTNVLEFIFSRIAKTRLKEKIPNLDLIHKISRLISLFVFARLAIIFAPVLQLPIKVNAVVIHGLQIVSAIFIIVLMIRIVDYIMHYFAKLAEKTESTMDDQLIPLVKTLIKTVIVIFGLFYLLQLVNVNVTALLAGISIGGLALALAAQDTVKNFFGSVMIFVDKPFQIGDWITFDGGDGTVEEVGLRSTRIRTFANSLVYVPNGPLADKVINNWGLRVYRRYKADIGVMYDTPPELIEAMVFGIKELVKAHPVTRKDYYEVHLNSFGASSLNILVYVFFKAPDWSTELKARHELMVGILKLAKRLGVSFAFPTQTLHIENFPEKESLSPHYETDPDKVQKAVSAYVEEFKNDISHYREDPDKYKPVGGG